MIRNAGKIAVFLTVLLKGFLQCQISTGKGVRIVPTPGMCRCTCIKQAEFTACTRGGPWVLVSAFVFWWVILNEGQQDAVRIEFNSYRVCTA
jgi:hypothetical protein